MVGRLFRPSFTKKLEDPPLEAPFWDLDWGGFSRVPPPNLGVHFIRPIQFRPLGKVSYQRPPWVTGEPADKYIPAKMSIKAAKVGLMKHSDPFLTLPEHLVKKSEQYLIQRMKMIWTDSPINYLSTYEESVALIKRDKSPGYPYNEIYNNKGAALDYDGLLIRQRTEAIIRGEQVPCYFTITEKSELRLREKVDADKTRIFFASDIHHLLASKMLFTKMNEQLMDKIGQHPVTLGIQIPGPEFVRALMRLGTYGNEADVSGCDLRFHPRIARCIRNLRQHFLPTGYHAAVNWLISTAYCGFAAGLGGLYRVYGNKSGHENTAVDNSFINWQWLIMACYHFYPDKDPDDVIKPLINSDDLVLKQIIGKFANFCKWMSKYGWHLEAPTFDEKPVIELVFLSHHIEERYVSGFGDFLVAAGNLDKLLSSLNWVKKAASLTFEESCVAHLLGVRLCLFPWAVHFEEADEILSKYLKKIQLTPFIRNALSARLNETQLAHLHTKVEGFAFFPDAFRAISSFPKPWNYLVLRFQPDKKEILKRTQFSTLHFNNYNFQSMAVRNTRKIDNLLDGLERQNLLTPEGRAWLIAACDPFHDEDFRLEGYPDIMTSSTVVQLVKKSFQVTVPTTGAGAVVSPNNWDCSIALYPHMATQTLNISTVSDATGTINAAGSATNGNTVGGIGISAGPQGNVLWPNASTVNPSATTTGIDCSDYLKGAERIIGMAFEVINTTSDLNKQGQVTAWRQPTLWSDTSLYIIPPVVVAGSFSEQSGYCNRFPPGTLADAQLLYGSRSWAAAEGAYVVARQSSMDNPIHQPSLSRILYSNTDSTYNAGQVFYSRGALSGNTMPSDIRCPFDISGVHFTGLSFTTTLTVNVRWIVERCPSQNETDLVVMATPSAPYDSLALELYCHCLRQMPPGVMLKENPLGEWFRAAISKVANSIPKVLQGVSTVAPIAGSLLNTFVPGAGIAGTLVGNAAGELKQLYRKPPLQGSASNFNSANLDTRTALIKKKKKKAAKPILRKKM